MASERKIAANRRNAQRSTGPKTPAGKAAVRHNALKHGLLAQEVVISSGDGRENQADFDQLLSELVQDLQPVGISEELLVQRIALCYWRLRRAARYETAEIRRSHGVPEAECDAPSVASPSFLDLLPGLSLLPGGGSTQLQRSSSGIDRLLQLLADVQGTVLVVGHLPEAFQDRLFEAFGREPGSVAQLCFAYSRVLTDPDEVEEQHPEIPVDDLPPEECRRAIIETLGEEHARLVSLREEVVKREALERERQALSDDLDRACLALPPEQATDRLLRYETAIERQLYKAMAELDRLQRRRRGDAVTPPLPREASPN